MPENTIPAMKKAIEFGATIIEFDVHISKDGQVIVYHDASFNPAYTTMPDGSEIPVTDRKKYTFYQMNYNEIRPFVVGKKMYAEYPQQEQIASYTPLLSELIDSVEAFTKSKQLPAVTYLLEVKSDTKTDGVEQPAPQQYMDILMKVLNPYKLDRRLIVQSFDVRPLQVLHRDHPGIALGFLTGDKNVSFEENLIHLGFVPTFYNPHYNLTNEALIEKAHAKNILVTPWTVNTLKEMQRLKSLKVDGIITDFPNLFKELD